MHLLRYLGAIAFVVLWSAVPALAEGETVTPIFTGVNWGAAAGGLGMALAAFGGVLAQGKITAAALEGIGRNPGASGNMTTPMILGLVFVETLVLFTLLIAFFLVGTQ